MTTTPQPAREHADLALGRIKPHPKNIRHLVAADDDLKDLAASIAQVGVEQAVTVVPAPTKGNTEAYYLVAGHRRHAAAKLAKAKTIPAVIRRDLDTQAAQVRFMWVENHHRKDLTVVEEGDGLQQIMDLEGLNQADLAKSVGKSKTTVRDRLRIAALPESARDRITTAQITIDDAVKLAEFNDDTDAQTQLEASHEHGPFMFQHTYQILKDQKRAAVVRAKTIRELEKAGTRVFTEEPSDYVDVDDLADQSALTATDNPADETAILVKARFEHQSCPGHAALIDPYGEAAWVCTQPDLHPTAADTARGHQGDDTQGDADTEAAEEAERVEAARREQDKQELASAAKVRRAHLGTLVKTSDTDRARNIILKHFDWIPKAEKTWEISELSVLSDVLYDGDASNLDLDVLRTKVKTAIDALPLAGLVILHSISARGEYDLESTREYAWRGTWSHTLAWRIYLEETGYEWSPVEQRMLAGDDPDNEDGAA